MSSKPSKWLPGTQHNRRTRTELECFLSLYLFSLTGTFKNIFWLSGGGDRPPLPHIGTGLRIVILDIKGGVRNV